ncbi:MAG: hypothetical protein A2161_16095 [Candidatus Schekmanbacteria bacterium RBG_13_48_7]|uniref:Uncharacterized protein n=1 Tax=Candidatus Schekmanbacteria bacterium RBG_13_48_7 TaxID=1817878 RepID=A0A1F7RR64_9BACT|nr:MAG: hypothetical protein A2161_16095 [Candidatus Schekmanbacteria bacterium RBG_13_48_7]
MNKQKKFDSVKTMRRIRDKMSKEIEGMSFEDQCNWLYKNKLKDPYLEQLMRKAAQQRNATDGVSHRS